MCDDEAQVFAYQAHEISRIFLLLLDPTLLLLRRSILLTHCGGWWMSQMMVVYGHNEVGSEEMMADRKRRWLLGVC